MLLILIQWCDLTGLLRLGCWVKWEKLSVPLQLLSFTLDSLCDRSNSPSYPATIIKVSALLSSTSCDTSCDLDPIPTLHLEQCRDLGSSLDHKQKNLFLSVAFFHSFLHYLKSWLNWIHWNCFILDSPGSFTIDINGIKFPKLLYSLSQGSCSL